MRRPILSIEDIRLLVDTFYSKVRNDSLLAPVFDSVIGHRWTEHLEKMYRFWQTVLLEEHTYHGSPFAPHAKLPVTGLHFERWTQLFHETITENFSGEKAAEALWRAQKMAELFQSRMAYYREHNSNLIK